MVPLTIGVVVAGKMSDVNNDNIQNIQSVYQLVVMSINFLLITGYILKIY